MRGPENRLLPWLLSTAITLVWVSTSIAEPADVEFKLKAADYFEHTIDFMVTITLGTFAVVGWLVKDSELTSVCARVWQFVAALGALSAGSLSLYFGYQSYLDLMSITGSGTFSYSALSGHYGYQALFLLSELPFLLLVLLVTTVWKKPK
jgi:hypothetical protein